MNFDALVDQIIRPQKAIYRLHTLGLANFYTNGVQVVRQDFQINSRGYNMACSYYYYPSDPPKAKRNCVIYCHAAGSSRIEALGLISAATQNGYTLFFFDFPANGMSEGEYVSFGAKEKDDIQTIIQWLRKLRTVDKIVLWGRSMGAIASIIYHSSHFDIDAIIADSPFYSFSKMSVDIARSRTSLPEFMVSPFLFFVKKNIETKAKFTFSELEIDQYIHRCIVPILFITSKQDKVTSNTHVEALYKIMYINKNHLEDRGQEFYDNIFVKFLKAVVPPPRNSSNKPMAPQRFHQPQMNNFTQKNGNFTNTSSKFDISQFIKHDTINKLDISQKKEQREKTPQKISDKYRSVSLVKTRENGNITENTKNSKNIREIKNTQKLKNIVENPQINTSMIMIKPREIPVYPERINRNMNIKYSGINMFQNNTDRNPIHKQNFNYSVQDESVPNYFIPTSDVSFKKKNNREFVLFGEKNLFYK